MKLVLHSILNPISELEIAKMPHMHSCHLLDLDLKTFSQKNQLDSNIIENEIEYELFIFVLFMMLLTLHIKMFLIEKTNKRKKAMNIWFE